MDKNKYTEKCMLLHNTKQFKKRDNDPMKTEDKRREDSENVEEN